MVSHTLHGGVIIARIIFPAERRVIGELLRLDEVLQPSSAGSMPSFCANVHATLDVDSGFRHPKEQ